MSFKQSFIALALLTGTSAAMAAPVFRVEAGYTQFDLERQIDESQRYMLGLVVDHHKDSFDSGNAFRLGAEAGWSAGEHVEWIAGASATYSADAEKESDITSSTYGWTIVTKPQSLDEMYMLSLRGGLRWQQKLTQKLRLHADAYASFNQWHYSYTSQIVDIEIDPDSSSGTQFVVRDVTLKDDDNYLALDATLGLYYAVTPALDAVLDAAGQLSQDYRNIQYTAGLRYSFR